MMERDVWLFIGTGAFFVGAFGVLQIVGWRSNRAIVGGTRRFAQIVMACGLGATAVLVLLLLPVKLDFRLFRGWPFIFLYTLSILSPLFVPAMLAIELVLLVELLLAKQAARSIRLWHVGALLSCTSWVAVCVLVSLLAPR